MYRDAESYFARRTERRLARFAFRRDSKFRRPGDMVASLSFPGTPPGARASGQFILPSFLKFLPVLTPHFGPSPRGSRRDVELGV